MRISRERGRAVNACHLPVTDGCVLSRRGFAHCGIRTPGVFYRAGIIAALCGIFYIKESELLQIGRGKAVLHGDGAQCIASFISEGGGIWRFSYSEAVENDKKYSFYHNQILR